MKLQDLNPKPKPNMAIYHETPFDNDVISEIKGLQKFPSVTVGDKKIYHWQYNMSVCKFNLGLMAKGMQVRGTKLKDFKAYYGLKGKSAKDCFTELLLLFEYYKKDRWNL